ncbi:unnamed protein product [Peniophora sp. CBMAI 1063]|nr:unnamed protein product [Peniophora sp. CBMAI 1063]
MSAMHNLAKQVFIQFIFDNKQIDWMREAKRLMQPIGTYANDERVLVEALATARYSGKSVESALYDLHSVNSHAEDVWRDYYVLHQHRLDGLVDAYLAAESSSASSSSRSFSDAEDKDSLRSRFPSAAPEELANSTTPSRATSPARLPSPDVTLEQYMDNLHVLLQEDHPSSTEGPEAIAEPDGPCVDPSVLAYSEDSSAEGLPEAMNIDEGIVNFNEAVTQCLTPHTGTPSLLAPSPESPDSVRYGTPSPSSSSSATESPPPETPSPSSSSSAGSPRRGLRLRKSKMREDAAITRGTALSPSSTASTSSPSSVRLRELETSPARGRFVYAMSEEMGRAGCKATLGDIKACARYLVEHPDVASMKCDRRGKEFGNHYKQRTAKAWSHIFTRFDTVIEDFAEAYRLSSPSS